MVRCKQPHKRHHKLCLCLCAHARTKQGLPHHLIVQALAHGVPGLIILHMAVVGVVVAVADAPSCRADPGSAHGMSTGCLAEHAPAQSASTWLAEHLARTTSECRALR